MALTCARCGAQNPDGNRFCNTCGTPLVPAAVPVGAAVATAAPPPPPAAYQSPYYAPPAGQAGPAVHRTPWVLIISIVVVMVLVLSGIGTVLALTLGHKTAPDSTFAAVSSPSPASPPGESPQPSPSAQPTQPSGGQTVSNDAETVLVPSGWTVLNKDADSVSLQSPDGDGTMTVAAGPFSPPENAHQIKDDIDKELAAKYPDAAACPGSTTVTGSLGGVSGLFWTECFTLSSGGQTVPVGEPLFAGANSSGSVGYVIALQTTQDNLQKFIKECTPILDSGITWNLK